MRAVPNSRYTVKGTPATVTVKDNDILQPPTTPTTTTVPVRKGPLGVPVVSCGAAASTSVTWVWDRVDSASSYAVIGPYGSGAQDAAYRDIGDVTSYTVHGLRADTPYRLYVRALDGTRNGKYTNTTCSTRAADTTNAIFPLQHDVSIVPQPKGKLTNSCRERIATDTDSGETSREYVCRFIEVKSNVIEKASTKILSASQADPTYGTILGLNTGDFYEGCQTYGSSNWKCSYEATNLWYQEASKATLQNYYLPALLAVDVPGKIKCVISIFEFVLGVPIGNVDPSGIINDCKATVT